ncbi:unnamed protein product [Tuber melanosporum]|uniref:(Perigord truffle) hypothetical protein n=1 Tax=Tuber melanosporum (strain Mel28) TaxID=656061 RepID=D5GBJ7_TUBMM|nr:uncharacterized protein GSTUM_00005665001 [Tuber melanosporum]CAZ82003.1 unnamed protein product [Tuber melanosporum]
MEKSGKPGSHDGVSAGGTNKNTGTDDDEDLDRSGVDRGGGNFGLGAPQTIERIRIEPVRRKTTHRRHQQLHARQNGVVSGITDLVGDAHSVLPSIVKTGGDIATTPPTPTSSILSPIPELSSLSIPSSSPGTVVPSTSPSDSTSYPDVPVGSTQQTVLSSTPPPSPAETSPGMVIPPITNSDIISTSLLTAELSSPSSTSSSSSTIVSPSTTVTSYWPSIITKNGTTTSDTPSASSITIDGTVIVFTSAPFPTGINNSTLSHNTTTSSTSLSFTSGWSLNSTTTTASSTTTTTTSSHSSESLWPTTADAGDGGGGGGGVAPTNTAPSVSPIPTEGSEGGGGAPVSPRLLGGVLGGVAGIALILLAVLYFVKRHKRELVLQARDDAGYGGPVEPAGDQPVAVVPGERGFYKVSGRKLPPVIGGPRPGELASPRSAAGSSYYHDDEISWIGGPGTPVSSAGAGPSRYSGVSGGAPSSPTIPTAPGSTTAPVGPAPILPPIGTAMPAGPSRIPEEHESDPELASPGESMPPPLPLPIAKTPSAPGSQTDLSLTSPTRPPFSGGMSSVSVGSAGSGKEGRSTGGVPVSAGPSVPPASARQRSAERAGSAGKDGVGRSLPSHDGSRASRFTEDIV